MDQADTSPTTSSSPESQLAGTGRAPEQVPQRSFIRPWMIKLLIMGVCGYWVWSYFSPHRSGSWDEEVQLNNGTIIWVKRTGSYDASSPELFGNGGGAFDNVVATIKVPANPVAPAPPEWRFEDAVPILLDYDEDKKTWYVVATFYMCDVWVKWGHPMPPYRQYEVQGNTWVVVPLDERLIGREGNLHSDLLSKHFQRITIEERKKMARGAGEKYRFIDDKWDRCKDSRPRAPRS